MTEKKITRKDLEARIKALTAEIDGCRRQNSELSVSERKYRNIFLRGVDSIFVIDPDTGAFLDCNEAAAQRLGYTRQELLRLPVAAINDTADQPLIPGRFAKQLAGDSIRFETVHLHKSGHCLPMEITSSMLEIDDRRMLLAFARDITARKETELALQVSVERYQALCGAVTDGLFVHEVEPDGGVGRFLEVNDVACQRLGTAARNC